MGPRGMKRPAAALFPLVPLQPPPTVSFGTWSVPPAPSFSQGTPQTPASEPRDTEPPAPGSSQEAQTPASEPRDTADTGPATPASPSLPGSSQDSSTTSEPASEPVPFRLFPDGAELVCLKRVVGLMEKPGDLPVNMFFCLDRKRLLYLSIEENLIPQIPKWNWSDPVHKVLHCHVEPGGPGEHLRDAHICRVLSDLEDLSHEELMPILGRWAVLPHSNMDRERNRPLWGR